MCVGEVRGGHGENVRESLKQVHRDYKNLLAGMMRKFSWMLLVLLVFSVYAEDEKEVVVGSAKELKEIKTKKIIWKKDGAQMVLVRPHTLTQNKEKKTFNRLGEPTTKKVKVSDKKCLLYGLMQLK